MMNYNRIYEYRFHGVDLDKKKAIWKEIADFIFKKLRNPNSILDPAAGQCEFINSIASKERWAVDMNDSLNKFAETDVRKVIGNNLHVELPDAHFDGVFVSNFLEHLNSQDEVALFLEKMHKTLKRGGLIAIMGPNFKYTYSEYFDFADHTVILTELGVAEHLFGAGFRIKEIHPRFLPLSFRGKLPVNRFLARLYLTNSIFWRFFGKQFLLIAEKE